MKEGHLTLMEYIWDKPRPMGTRESLGPGLILQVEMC